MAYKLCKWCNGLGVRLPAWCAERTGLRAGDYLFIRLTDQWLIEIRPVKERDIPAGYQPADATSEAKLKARPREQATPSLYSWSSSRVIPMSIT